MSAHLLTWLSRSTPAVPLSCPQRLRPLLIYSATSYIPDLCRRPSHRKARGDGLVTVDMGLPELNGPKVPTTLPTNAEGMVLTEPITVREEVDLVCVFFLLLLDVVLRYQPRVAGVWLPSEAPESLRRA